MLPLMRDIRTTKQISCNTSNRIISNNSISSQNVINTLKAKEKLLSSNKKLIIPLKIPNFTKITALIAIIVIAAIILKIIPAI